MKAKAEDYLKHNKISWDKRTIAHLDSDFYDNINFIKGRNSLNEIELNLLGDISNKSILHLQCHFGQDSISLSRMGAHVTGVDFSDKGIDEAKKLAQSCQTDTQFIHSDIYSLKNVHDTKYDIIFTTYGTIGWLPDIEKWAKTVSHFLKPDGRLVFVEFHPFIWMYDDYLQEIKYRYFNSGPIIETQAGTYADNKAEIEITDITWNHSLSEVFTALMNNGISIKQFQEFDYSPYNCFQQLNEYETGKYRFSKHGDKLPMVYALEGVKV